MGSIDRHTTENKPGLPNWSEILQTAVSQPGSILKAYSAFHGFSLGNQIAAMMQCKERGIEPGPINTYVGWLNLNRQVKKGEKALWLCMPITCKRKNDQGEDEQVLKSFIWRPRWFVLAQTEGEPVPMPDMPEWDKARALVALAITEAEFTMTDGNVMGYAKNRQVAISPLSPLPHKTLFHELAHIELGHCAESSFNDSEHTPRDLREVEAESVALLLCETLDLTGADYARGYIQNWLESDVIPEKSAQKIFGAADGILRAGREATAIK
jgi:hypothetical protein